MVEDTGQAQTAEDYWRLLAAAAVQFRRHEVWRREPFNVFSVLRSGSDEVNLHSRFLAALLNYRKAPDAPRENLVDFLKTIAEKGMFAYEASDCEKIEKARGHFRKTIAESHVSVSSGIRIERESDNIDILIVNDAEQKWAVAIENKIWAGDQPQQLWRYYDLLKGYGNRIMLYLTLDGHKPENHSIYSEDKKCRVPEDRLCLASYRGTLLPWLERCQKRAYDEPSLREAIDQYLRLVRKLTGKDRKESYMKELETLCVEGDNPRLIYDLYEALINAKISLLVQLWEDIECALFKRIGHHPREEWVDVRGEITGYVRGGKAEFGLYWSLEGCPSGTSLGVEMLTEGSTEGILLGIRLSKNKYRDEYDKLVEIAKNKGMEVGDDKWDWYPCSKMVDSHLLPENFNRNSLAHHRWEHIEFLRDGDRRKALATVIAEDLKDLKQIWDAAHQNPPA